MLFEDRMFLPDSSRLGESFSKVLEPSFVFPSQPSKAALFCSEAADAACSSNFLLTSPSISFVRGANGGISASVTISLLSSRSKQFPEGGFVLSPEKTIFVAHS